MTTSEQAIVAVVEKYQDAANSRDPSKFREVLALGDSRFTEIEDHITEPFGSDWRVIHGHWSAVSDGPG